MESVLGKEEVQTGAEATDRGGSRSLVLLKGLWSLDLHPLRAETRTVRPRPSGADSWEKPTGRVTAERARSGQKV